MFVLFIGREAAIPRVLLHVKHPEDVMNINKVKTMAI